VSLTGSLFPRIAPQAAPSPAAASAAPPPAPAVPGIATIAYEDFMKVELRTAKVVTAEKVQGADKLLCLQVEVGGETRQVVAGIAKHYAPEALIGKTVIVVANLAAAKIRGVESRGMLLAATAGDAMRLLTVDGDLPSGARAK
jgi:methionyl-tRNA synthetase